MDERKVLITPHGLGRFAIVRRHDGMFCLYEYWRWSEMQEAMNVQPVKGLRWSDGGYDRGALYEDVDPLPGLFGSVRTQSVKRAANRHSRTQR